MISKLSSLLLVSIFFLSGCTVKSDVIQSDSSISSSQSGASVENNQSEKALESSNSYDYTVAAAFDMVTRGSGNENGFYQIVSNENGYANLFYTDYTTANRVYLCGVPNCAHNTTTCTSYIDNTDFSVFPAVYKDYLFLIYSSYSTWSNEPVPSRVECMDLNGGNRHVLFTFDSDITLNDGAIVGNNELVISGYKIDYTGDSINSVPFIGAISIDSGTYHEIYSLSDVTTQEQTNLFLRGVSDTGFILKTVSMKDNTDSSKSTSRIFELSFDGKNETDLLTFSGTTCFEEHNGRELVYLRFDPHGVSLYKRSRQSNQEEQVAENILDFSCVRKTDLPYNQDNLYIVGFVGDYVLLNHLYDEKYDEYGNIALYYTQYAVNLTNGSSKEITLYNNIMATQKPINIITKFGDSLLVDAVEEIIDGIAYRCPAIITDENYLKSNPQYIMIQSPIDESLQLY